MIAFSSPRFFDVFSSTQVAKELQRGLVDAEEVAHQLEIQVQKAKGKGKRGGDTSGDTKALQEEIERLTDAYDQEHEDLMSLRDHHEKLKTDHAIALEDLQKTRLQEQNLNKILAEKEKLIADMGATNRMDKSKSQSVSKQRSEAMEESRRQRAENQRLLDQVEALENESVKMTEEKELMVHLLEAKIQEAENLSIENNNFNVVKDAPSPCPYI